MNLRGCSEFDLGILEAWRGSADNLEGAQAL